MPSKYGVRIHRPKPDDSQSTNITSSISASQVR